MNNFTKWELETMSLGLIGLIENANKAYGLVTDTRSRTAISEYRDELVALNSKLCGMMPEE